MAEDKGKAWEEYVRAEVKSLLDLYLPETESGNVGIKYVHPIKEMLETGPEYDEDQVAGVIVKLVFQFIKPMPIMEDE